MKSVDINISIPKFKIQNEYSLRDSFSRMGVNDLFTPGRANLSGMTGNNQAYVSHIYHASIFAVNEEGAEAAGASRTEVVHGTHPDFKANRSFIVMVKDKLTGFIILFARVCEPKWHGLP